MIWFKYPMPMPGFSSLASLFSLQFKHGEGRNKCPKWSDPIRFCSCKWFFPREKFRRVKNLLSRLLLGSPRCFFNNYSVHCCAHITLGRSRTRDNGEFVAIAVMFRLKYASAATGIVHVQINSWADCVCESGISASFPIMAAALLPGPGSPLLFFGKREL